MTFFVVFSDNAGFGTTVSHGFQHTNATIKTHINARRVEMSIFSVVYECCGYESEQRLFCKYI